MRQDINEAIEEDMRSSPKFHYEDAVFDEVFKELDYGEHFLIMGDVNTGKSNLVAWALQESKKRMVFSISKECANL